MPVELTENGLLINGEEVPVYSGTVHYWRLERDRWDVILDQVRALGFRMVETYIPWSVHETAPASTTGGRTTRARMSRRSCDCARSAGCGCWCGPAR